MLMNPKQMPPQPAPGLNLGDIYYILFRRKWLILGCALLGFVAAGVAYARFPLKYVSVAELYIGYVTEMQTPYATGRDANSMIPRSSEASILNTELEIVQSFDVLEAVAETLGPGAILGEGAATNAGSAEAAGRIIEDGLHAEVPPTTQIIRLSFSHRNPEVVKPVLNLLITNYIIKHAAIHQRTEMFNSYLNSQTDMRRMRLKSTEEELAKAKSNGGVVDLAAEKAAFTAQEGKLVAENYMAMAELDEAEARANVLSNLMKKPMTPVHDQAAATSASVVRPPTAAEVEAYNQARQHLVDLQTSEAKLESWATTNNSQVKTNLIELAEAQAHKNALEEANPGLLMVAAAETKAPGAPAVLADPAAAYDNELTTIAGLKARISRQTNELALSKDRGASLVQLEVNLHELERNKEIDEAELKEMEMNTEKANMDEELGPNRVSNISVSEQPTQPVREVKKRAKLVAALAGGGVALGLGLAFLLEMFLDHSLKRPQEVASKLALPFFLSVPYQKGNGLARMVNGTKAVKLLAAGGDAAKAGGADGGTTAPPGGGVILAWDEKRFLRPFYETLRDRLIAFFEALNLTHKPKLVALTSCHRGAGVSTMATGLASALSETGDGNVLLVNMNSEEGDAHRYHKGELSLGLDDLFEKEKTNRENALVRENLYVVKESSNRDKLPAILPKRFSHLVSKMKASDYDYIIFDMPPVTQISVTPRLARFMDMVLLVVESEKTSHEAAQWAAALLSESKANVGVVLNKSRSYVPRRLHQEI
jgi:uncharacterized protein involved in exopolysaccharide biosynthesis/Mrp family chromosome partitioning ATPase